MKITALMENTTCNPDLATEHGLSLLIETDHSTILFDAGQSAAFADNAAALGVDLNQVDIAILSHGHYDHGGGLLRFFECNNHAPVYLNQHGFSPCYHGSDRYIGLDPALEGHPRLKFVEDTLDLNQYLSLSSKNHAPKQLPIDSAGLCIQQGEDYLPDQFLHEQYLTIKENGKTILISGCSHKGILNIVDWYQPDILIGGFHFMNVSIEDGASPLLDHAAKVLSGYPTQYYTCHCTGLPQYEYLKARMGEQLQYLSTGHTLSV